MTTDNVPNPLENSLPAPPAVSKTTIPITGLLVDIYGLEEVPASATRVSVLWLHNPRLGDRERMGDIARRCVAAHNETRPAARGLIGAAFDQRNHGVREVHGPANQAWRSGNPRHAQDMLGIISGTVVDTRLLIDALGGYVFSDGTRPVELDRHLQLGVSLGGHSGWQLMFADPRVTAAALIVGCPDFQSLMKDRARLSKLETYDKADKGASFLGSKDFPPALVSQAAQFDPKGICFGTGDVSVSPSEQEQKRLRPILDSRVRGKKFLLCLGADDKLVPWRCSEPFTEFFTTAAKTWYKDGNVSVQNNIYPGRGHEFSPEMIKDAVQFVCDVVASTDSSTAGMVGSFKI